MEHCVSLRPLARIAGALLLAAAPAAATAQTVTPALLSNLSLSKSQAILGGDTSALAQIVAEQRGIPLTERQPIQPASLPRLSATRAVARAVLPYSPGVKSGRPDLFGSVALSVSHTPLDWRWHKVEHARVGGSHAAYARSLRTLAEVDRIEAVNRYVNRRVRFVDDSRQFGRADVWLSASETLRRGRGDCEDYAIAKLQMLRAAGVDDDDMYVSVVKDLVRRADHAVLVVRAGGKMLLLDNGTDTVLDSDRVRDYRPVMTFAANGSWTHGYRRSLAPVTYAAAEIKPLAPASKR